MPPQRESLRRSVGALLGFSPVHGAHFSFRMVVPPQRGAHFDYVLGHEHHLGSKKWSYRLRAVRILKNELSLAHGAHFHAHLRTTNAFGTPPDPSPLRTCHRALAYAACSFLNKTALSPGRRAHFAFKPALEQSYRQFQTPLNAFSALERATWPVYQPERHTNRITH